MKIQSTPIRRRGAWLLKQKTCSVIDSPEAELRHLKELAKANGFDSITEAIVAAKHYREIEAVIVAKITRRKKELHAKVGIS